MDLFWLHLRVAIRGRRVERLEIEPLCCIFLMLGVVTDEIGWLDFYGSYVQINCKEKRSKHNARQAEKEIISSVVFTVCYDVFSGFAHFNR
ncbi:hypothetical protein JHK82_057431 [Glycine max]|nr:hypothetical protein JHK82_057431 [Glycine max]